MTLERTPHRTAPHRKNKKIYDLKYIIHLFPFIYIIFLLSAFPQNLPPFISLIHLRVCAPGQDRTIFGPKLHVSGVDRYRLRILRSDLRR
ncbi:hypothetical protein L1987_75160 [Smallanthus sonchifolius]|uniref:Uncharacterized protein n=1 Tax=Smallanthus sonchifolius TaxID=185202 RepID=A0ACB9A4P3_9ASTR|nr:hypothetical protein L1987_75160 [Smallanthus sonchifolius]